MAQQEETLRTNSALLWIDPDLFRLVLPQGQMITAKFDFDRVAQRGKPNEFDRSSDEQSHFQKSSTILWRNLDLADRRGAADLEGSQRLKLGGHGHATEVSLREEGSGSTRMLSAS